MFYSHEILSNSQYGVATIWLVATVGKGARKVTRKAIQDVNVPKACETIIEPGAPLALRLQGNLLYGTARVYAQQCGYMLADAEKTQSDMMTFFRVVQTSETDPAAGKTKRKNIILEDDPNFDPFGSIPSLDIVNCDTELVLKNSQASWTRYSQLSPFSQGQQSSSSGRQPSIFGLDLPLSSHSAGTYRLPSDLGYHDSPFAKQATQYDAMAEFQPFGENIMDPFGGIGLDFDEDGNLIGIVDNEVELPSLPRPATAGTEAQEKGSTKAIQDQHSQLFMDDDMLMLEEPALPDAEAFAVRKHNDATFTPTTESTETGRAVAKNRKVARRKAKTAIILDENDHITREEFRSWTDNYVGNMREASRKRHKSSTLVDARKNALDFIFGNGVADVGMARVFGGITHPLAAHFSGKALERLLQGHQAGDDEEVEATRGRRRRSSEAFEEEDEEHRRVKQKTSGEAELGRNLHDDGDVQFFGDDTAPEIGMDAMAAMAERHSSSMMPWSHPGSAVPGSSIRGSAQKLAPAPSPLLGRGKLIHSIEHRSDPVMPTSDDFGNVVLHDDHSSLDLLNEPAAEIEVDTDLGGVVILDAASQQFLGYVAEQAMNSRDEEVGPSGKTKRWVGFERLANPATHSRAVAAQAFLHVLSLATKNVVTVHQDGADELRPLGTISIGVAVKAVGGDAKAMLDIASR